MTLFNLRQTYKTALNTIYSLSEIDSIFSLIALEFLEMDKAEVIINGKKELSEPTLILFQQTLIRLKKKEPIQYILGETFFFNLPFKVNEAVLIPRPETEELVDWILKDVQKENTTKKISILDIGTGSGCIAISLAKNLPNAEVWAMDISEKALTVAKKNAVLNNVAIHFIKQDILSTTKLLKYFDIIVSNPPYVRMLEKKQMHENVTTFEPNEALYVADDNPLIFYDKIADLSNKHLNKQGSLYFEINQYIASETISLLQEKGYTDIVLRKDFLENDRMIRAKE